MKREQLPYVAVFAALVALCVVARIAPHAPNFTPLAAAALFAGFYFRRVWVAAAVPLTAMLIGDSIIGGYTPGVMLTVYAAMLAPLAWRRWLRGRLSPARVGAAALAGSGVFFLSTNFAHWAFTRMFEPTLAGLGQCYAAALPFLKYTIAGDLVWSGVIFGIYATATALAPRLRSASSVPACG
ncbi:MAG: hypothetical protein HRF50_06140 [Phycisphaerae bacterium]|jgi:hypothetical protein